MNNELIQYGIFECESDWCIHIGIHTRRLFFYETKDMKDLIRWNEDEYGIKEVENKEGIITARGFLVPYYEDIIKTSKFPKSYLSKKCHPAMDEIKKGKLAENIVNKGIDNGKLNDIFLIKKNITEENIQYKGIDIIIKPKKRAFSIQVKCDWYAGSFDEGGTGNIFVQTHECNPYKKY